MGKVDLKVGLCCKILGRTSPSFHNSMSTTKYIMKYFTKPRDSSSVLMFARTRWAANQVHGLHGAGFNRASNCFQAGFLFRAFSRTNRICEEPGL